MRICIATSKTGKYCLCPQNTKAQNFTDAFGANLVYSCFGGTSVDPIDSR